MTRVFVRRCVVPGSRSARSAISERLISGAPSKTSRIRNPLAKESTKLLAADFSEYEITLSKFG